MSPKRPYASIPWDPRSDQPARVKDESRRRLLRRGSCADWAVAAATAAVYGPCWLAAYVLLRERPLAVHDLLSLAISPWPGHDAELQDLVQDLGIQRLQIRLPLWDRVAQAAALATIAGFPRHDWLVVVPQDRRAVCDHGSFTVELRRLLALLPAQVATVQVGNAVNRLKWGCASVGEYLPLAAIAAREIRAHPRLRLAGSAVIDFEPLATLRSLVHRHPVRLDVASALLYVDRRGPPEARQYGFFDTRRKLRTIAAALRLSSCAPRRLWLTEVNWPLAGHGAHAPTSGTEAVDEAAAAVYLERYLRIVAATGLAERIYVWQLVAQGYGLVDPRDGRRRPAYAMVHRLVREGGRSEPAVG